jgi:hypothetical protein
MYRSVLPSVVTLKVKWCFIALPASYLAESGFSWVTYLLSNICNCIEAVNIWPYLSLSTLQPDNQILQLFIMSKEHTDYNANI